MTGVDIGRAVAVTESTYLIDGWLYLPGHAGVRVAYAVPDQFGWAVMARRSRHVVTVARADRPSAAHARARAVQLVRHYTAGWRRPDPAAA